MADTYLMFLHLLTSFIIMAAQLTLVSYNSKGLGVGRIEYINSLLLTADIILLQEHWLYESGFNILERANKDICVHALSAMHEDEQLTGRPYGGCVIIWKMNLKCHITLLVLNLKEYVVLRLSVVR